MDVCLLCCSQFKGTYRPRLDLATRSKATFRRLCRFLEIPKEQWDVVVGLLTVHEKRRVPIGLQTFSYKAKAGKGDKGRKMRYAKKFILPWEVNDNEDISNHQEQEPVTEDDSCITPEEAGNGKNDTSEEESVLNESNTDESDGNCSDWFEESEYKEEEEKIKELETRIRKIVDEETFLSLKYDSCFGKFEVIGEGKISFKGCQVIEKEEGVYECGLCSMGFFSKYLRDSKARKKFNLPIKQQLNTNTISKKIYKMFDVNL